MVTIRITGITEIAGSPTTYELILDGNGKGKGHHIAHERDEDVQWQVLGSSGVSRISDIKWKPVSGSTDIFGAAANNKPTRVTDTKWRAKVNNITEDVIYVYSIKFVRDHPTDTNIYDFDPIISVKPSERSTGFLGIISGVLGGGLVSLISWRSDRMKNKNEMKILKKDTKKLRGN